MNSREQVGLQVRRFRAKRGLTQRQLADFAQRTERWLRNIEQGRTAVTFEDAEKLSLGLRVNVQAVLGFASLKEEHLDQRRIRECRKRTLTRLRTTTWTDETS